MTKDIPPLPKKKPAVFHHPLGFELYDGLAMDLHAMTYAESMLKEIDRLRAEVSMLRTGDTCARQCEGTAYRIESRQQKRRADALAATIRSLQDIVTHSGETKDEFIARVRAVLGADPNKMLRQQPEPNSLTCHISADDPRYPTLVIQGDFGSAGYTIDPATGELERCCICSAHSAGECCCGYFLED